MQRGAQADWRKEIRHRRPTDRLVNRQTDGEVEGMCRQIVDDGQMEQTNGQTREQTVGECWVECSRAKRRKGIEAGGGVNGGSEMGLGSGRGGWCSYCSESQRPRVRRKAGVGGELGAGRGGVVSVPGTHRQPSQDRTKAASSQVGLAIHISIGSSWAFLVAQRSRIRL